jgi:hypothetical protein
VLYPRRQLPLGRLGAVRHARKLPDPIAAGATDVDELAGRGGLTQRPRSFRRARARARGRRSSAALSRLPADAGPALRQPSTGLGTTDRLGVRLRRAIGRHGTPPPMIASRGDHSWPARTSTVRHRGGRDSCPLGSGFESLTAHTSCRSRLYGAIFDVTPDRSGARLLKMIMPPKIITDAAVAILHKGASGVKRSLEAEPCSPGGSGYRLPTESDDPTSPVTKTSKRPAPVDSRASR